MILFAAKRSLIHPEDQNDLAYWSRKWGVSARQIYDAILETGSTQMEDIRNVLRKKGTLKSLWFGVQNFFKEALAMD